MSDIFISYASPDRARAERLKAWFEEAGWSVWIDRAIDLGEGWEQQIQNELDRAALVVVLWGPAARRSEWVQREASVAQQSGRLLQVHATGLPLLPPFDVLQAVRMQSWSGEAGHSERVKLLRAVADRLGKPLPPHLNVTTPDEALTAYHEEISEALELAFYYCARQVERVRLQRERGYGLASDFEEIGSSFTAMLALLRTDEGTTDDREGILHRLMEDFLNQLLLLAPDPNALT
ncbi:MAG TPA: toll/interleukin-1 receptor domain-containing protein [Nitrospira sp.]|nr:toll/interleukin-1 receptor domain-containing protein [Nitrospira sp.]